MEQWWKRATVYQIYPLSFCDSNGDGKGDIKGIIRKLDYLKKLGVEILWLSPVYESPMDDNGYDISNYYQINPMFGTMADFSSLLEEAHRRGLKIIMDLVVNHTSDEHPWFKEAKKSKDNPYRDYYIWKDPVNHGVPTPQQSIFSGPAWEYDAPTGQYFFHLFSKRQPDLNWDNENLRKEIYQMINWWLDRGIDGFRMDVIDLIGKDINLNIFSNGPTLHERLHEMYQKCFAGRKMMTVGETPGATVGQAKLYTEPDREELDMVFTFQHISLDEIAGKGKWDLKTLNLLDLKHVFTEWQKQLHDGGWNSLYWSNHDQPRIVSRFGDDTVYRIESAKMLATLLHFMQGTPYVYQGEEIGMTNVKMKFEDYKDIETLNMYEEKRALGWPHEKIMQSIYAKGRDNARTPMQWDSSAQAGFTSGTSWIKVNPNYENINVETALNDPDSVFYYYQKLIQLRKDMDIIVYGDFELLLEEHENVFAYLRRYRNEKILVICNFYRTPAEIQLPEYKDAEYLIGNYVSKQLTSKMTLLPYESLVYLIHEENQ